MTSAFGRSLTTRGLWLLGLAVSLGMATACSSDDSDNDAGAGETGGSGGQGGADAGDDGSDETGGSGGSDEPGGSGGTGGGGEIESPLTEVFADAVPGIDTLLGLTFAKDGKIYASGYVTVDGDRRTAAVRFNADGTLDTSFGDNGIATYNVAVAADDAHPNPPANYVAGNEGSYGIVELANGDVIVQTNANDGEGGQDVVLIKFDSEGNFDTDFGVVRIDLGWVNGDTDWPGELPPSDQSWGIALDTSGDEEKVVVFAHGPAKKGSTYEGVQRTDQDRYVVRVLASDGSLDTSFASGGIFTFDFDDARLSDGGRRGIVEADGSILQAGYTNFGDGQNNHVGILRLLPDGTPDTSFGFGTTSPGMTKFNPFKDKGGFAEAYNVTRLSTGAYVTTGYGKVSSASVNNDLVSFRIAGDELDTTWGENGAFTVLSEPDPTAGKGAQPNRENGRDLVRLADDSTFHVGCYDDFAAVFLATKDGFLDESFGDGGKVVYDFPSPFFKVAQSASGDRIAAVTQGSEGKVFLAIFAINSN